mmetsp:Transcript_70743/g.182407  ORF Transcript_70743/g.182407 Transcript_70743/m.182407 type:complete len:220 (+) Transcript_70743:556-1215(+)
MPPTVLERHCCASTKVSMMVASTVATDPESKLSACATHSRHKTASTALCVFSTHRTLPSPIREPWRHERNAATFSDSPRMSHSSSTGRPSASVSTKQVAIGGATLTGCRVEISLRVTPVCSVVEFIRPLSSSFRVFLLSTFLSAPWAVMRVSSATAGRSSVVAKAENAEKDQRHTAQAATTASAAARRSGDRLLTATRFLEKAIFASEDGEVRRRERRG